MNKLLIGVLYGVIAQILTFLQLQGNIKYGWFQKYPIILLASAIPISFMFIKSVENFVSYYGGEIWPSRLIGFGIGVIVFTLMSKFMFGEPFTTKTGLSLFLGTLIVLIQIFWR